MNLPPMLMAVPTTAAPTTAAPMTATPMTAVPTTAALLMAALMTAAPMMAALTTEDTAASHSGSDSGITDTGTTDTGVKDTGVKDTGSPPPPPIDLDGDGWSIIDGDCDDTDIAIHPDAVEVCDDADNDCDTLVDEGVVLTWHLDFDGDGYGGTAFSMVACEPFMGFVASDDDCDDLDDLSYPGADELCDDKDNDCDGSTDEGVLDAWYTDEDSDGYGSGSPIYACEMPDGLVHLDGDCNDSNSEINPDHLAFMYDTWDGPSGATYDWNCDGVEEQWIDHVVSYDYEATLALVIPGSDAFVPCVDFVSGWDWYVPDCSSGGTHITACAMFWGPWGPDIAVGAGTTLQACR